MIPGSEGAPESEGSPGTEGSSGTDGSPGSEGAPRYEGSLGTEGVPPSRKARTPSLSGARNALITLVSFLQAHSAFPQEPPGTALTRFFQSTQHLQADFTQLEYDGDGVFRKESTGRLYVARPGRFRLDYLEPDELMIWADGESLSMFDKELEQVTVYKQARQLRESAAALLAGDASVLENYQVKEAEFDDGLQWFDLTGADVEEGDLRLALRGSVPAVLEFADDLGSRVRMLLFRLELDSELDDDVFTPTIPPGVDIFEAAES